MRIKASGSNRRVAASAVDNFMCSGDVRCRGEVFVLRDVRLKPTAALCVCHGVCNHDANVGECGSRADDDIEIDGHEILTENLQPCGLGQRVLRSTDATLD